MPKKRQDRAKICYSRLIKLDMFTASVFSPNEIDYTEYKVCGTVGGKMREGLKGGRDAIALDGDCGSAMPCDFDNPKRNPMCLKRNKQQ